MAFAATNKSILCSSIVILAMLVVAKTAPRDEMYPGTAGNVPKSAPSQICETTKQTDVPVFYNGDTGVFSYDSGMNQEPHFYMTLVFCAENGTPHIKNKDAICQQEYVYLGPKANRLSLEVGCSLLSASHCLM